MRTKTQLAILQQLNSRHAKATGLAKGFTLVELMIVVAVIGILSAVALPQYLQARAAAAAGAAIGQQVGLAKECATAVAAGGIGLPAGCSVASGGTYSQSWASTGTVTGLRCLSTVASTVAAGQVSIGVAGTTGALSCTLS